jgi:hypothetical protein
MDLESEKSLIWGFLTQQVLVPKISAEPGLNNMIFRIQGLPVSKNWAGEGLFRDWEQNGAAEQMPFLFFGRVGPDIFFVGLNLPAGIFSLEYFHECRYPGNVS